MFGFFKRKKPAERPEEPSNWDTVWDLWADGELPSPYQELMTYQSEVNNGGHDQYFINTESDGELEEALSALGRILPEVLERNLQVARAAFVALEWDEDDENAQSVLERCDEVFFAHEEEIDRLLTAFADTLGE